MNQRIYVWAAGWCALPLAAVHLVLVVAAITLGRISVPTTGWSSLAIATLVHLLIPIWAAALGSTIGRFLPTVYAGFAGSAAVLAAFLLLGGQGSGFSGTFALLYMGSGSAPRVGYLYNVGYLLAQVAILAAMVVAWRWCHVTERSGRVVPNRVGTGACAAMVFFVLAAQHASALPGNRYLVDATPPSECSGSSPVICTYPEHQRLRDDVVAKVEHLAESAFAGGYHGIVPREFHEESRTYHPTDPDVRGLLMPLESGLYQDHIDWWDVANALAVPTHCDELRAEIAPPEVFWNDLRSLRHTWLYVGGITSDDEPDIYFDPELDVIFTPEQAAAVVDRFSRCELEAAT